MKDIVTIGETGVMTVGKPSAKEGFTGKVPRLTNYFTQTLVKPGAKLKDVKFSLETIMRDIESRIGDVGEEELF